MEIGRELSQLVFLRIDRSFPGQTDEPRREGDVMSLLISTLRSSIKGSSFWGFAAYRRTCTP